MSDVLFDPVRVGTVVFRNRIVRAGTAESMADDSGAVTEPLVDLYRRLAATRVGAIVTGHAFVAPGGRGAARQLAIDDDRLLPGLRRLTDAVHRHGAPVVAQLAHAGSQSRDPEVDAVGPSAVSNPLTGRVPRQASERDIAEIIERFAAAAVRAHRAGFDAVHVHAANGYLLSQFSSPLTNRRNDRWGGDGTRRDALPLAVVSAIRSALPAGFPVLYKLGAEDSVPGGVALDESLQRARRLVEAGVDGFEVSCGLMGAPSDSAARFVAVGPLRAARDLLPPWYGRGLPEGTFLAAAGRLRQAVPVPVMATGGFRTIAAMRAAVEDAAVDLVGLARPFIRQPDLADRIAEGELSVAACTSCNLCLRHSGSQPLRCWRVPRRRILEHVLSTWRKTG